MFESPCFVQFSACAGLELSVLISLAVVEASSAISESCWRSIGLTRKVDSNAIIFAIVGDVLLSLDACWRSFRQGPCLSGKSDTFVYILTNESLFSCAFDAMSSLLYSLKLLTWIPLTCCIFFLKSPISASRDMGIKYSSSMSSFDGGVIFAFAAEVFFLLSLWFPMWSSVFGQFKADARRTTVHWKMTSATVGNGSDKMLKGSKFLLEWLHSGHVTRLYTWPMERSDMMERLRRRNRRHASWPSLGSSAFSINPSSSASTMGFFFTRLPSSWSMSNMSFISSWASCWSVPQYWERTFASEARNFSGARAPYLPLHMRRSSSENSSRILPPVPNGLSLFRSPLIINCPLNKYDRSSGKYDMHCQPEFA